MIRIDNINETNFEIIPIDPFWNTGSEQESKMHRIHAYPAKFPAFITTKALEFAAQNSIRVNQMADIFCGCGTTAYESKRSKINFWGCDINPVATLIAKTKSRKYLGWHLQKYLVRIIETYNSYIKYDAYSTASDRLKYWYKQKEYNNLFFLKRAIESSTPNYSDYRRFFLCAYSNILKSTSVWLTKSIKPQVDPNKVPADVLDSFITQCKFMIRANEESDLTNIASTNIVTGNFLDEKIKVPMVDLIVTSPPYVTSYEYADLHQLSSLWLNFADDYRDLRKGSIGSLYHDPNLNKTWKNLNSTGSKIIARLYDQEKSRAKSVAKYFLDIQVATSKSYRMLNNAGMALFVIADTEYKGVLIENAKHLSESLLSAGFAQVFATKRKISKKILTPYRDERGKFSSNSDGRMVYSEEYIIIGRK